jgi:hypothetical protein
MGPPYGRTDCLILPNREIPRKIGQKLSGIRMSLRCSLAVQ